MLLGVAAELALGTRLLPMHFCQNLLAADNCEWYYLCKSSHVAVWSPLRRKCFIAQASPHNGCFIETLCLQTDSVLQTLLHFYP
jgi:hypothetical protein